jgi:lysophospholipase L1-like esterase
MRKKSLLTLLALSLLGAAFWYFWPEVKITAPGITGLNMQIFGRQILVAAGAVRLANGKRLQVRGRTFNLAPCPGVSYRDEPFQLVSVDSPDPFPWTRTPKGTAVCGTTVSDVLVPTSIRIKTEERDLSGDINFDVDPVWGRVLSMSSAGADGLQRGEMAAFGELTPTDAHNVHFCQPQNVFLDYTIRQRRLSTIYVDTAGTLQLSEGVPSRGSPSPPAVPPGAIVLANVLVPSFSDWLGRTDIMPVSVAKATTGPDQTAAFAIKSALSATAKKLHAGRPLRVDFIGDRAATIVDSREQGQPFFQRFLSRLQKRYPHSSIVATSYGGSADFSSSIFPGYLAERAGQGKKADLVIVAMANDLVLSRQQLRKNYYQLARALKDDGTDLIVCLPLLPAPTVYGLPKNNWQAVAALDYYREIPALAERLDFALADVRRRSLNCYLDGLRPELLLADRLYQPNDRGEAIYAEELIGCFAPLEPGVISCHSSE